MGQSSFGIEWYSPFKLEPWTILGNCTNLTHFCWRGHLPLPKFHLIVQNNSDQLQPSIPDQNQDLPHTLPHVT